MIDSIARTMPMLDIASSIDRTTPLADRMKSGLETMFLGLGTVFAVLILLWGILVLFRVVFYDLPSRRKAAEKKPETIEPQAETLNKIPQAEDAVPSAQDHPTEAELAAAISAAISLYLESTPCANGNPPSTAFRVVNFRKISRN